jgi:hypothetical protein
LTSLRLATIHAQLLLADYQQTDCLLLDLRHRRLVTRLAVQPAQAHSTQLLRLTSLRLATIHAQLLAPVYHLLGKAQQGLRRMRLVTLLGV